MQPSGSMTPVYPLYLIRRSRFELAERNMSAAEGLGGAEEVVVELDVHRVADHLVRKLGEDAPLHAFGRARKLLNAGDLEGFAAWNRVMVTASQRLADSPADTPGKTTEP